MAERILIVDDEQDTRETMTLFLMRQGHEVHGAPNGERAWDMLKQKTYDLVLLDIMMPGMSGFDLLQQIRSTPTMKRLPIIMVTALDKTSDIVKAFEMGADDYITKPFVNAELIARVNTTLRHHHLEQEQSRGLKLEPFKKALAMVAREMNQPLIQLTRVSKQLFKEAENPNPDWVGYRRSLYDQCVRIQLILKQLEKIKSLNV